MSSQEAKKGINSMARYIGPVCRLCRREGVKLFLKGRKCETAKCILERRPSLPGMHGQKKAKTSDYGVQLREKQKLKRFSGMLEKQFKNSFFEAARQKGVTGDNLLAILNLRLDNVILQSGFGISRRHARQLVSHGHIVVNNHKVSIPSFITKQGDKIEIRGVGKSKDRVREFLEITEPRKIPEWLKVSKENLTAEILRKPERMDFDFPIQETMIVELYSK